MLSSNIPFKIFTTLACITAAFGYATIDKIVPRSILDNPAKFQYATHLTQNIVPKQIHSHNDYWRNAPVLEAIANGVMSIEADVWLYNETLYIGHEVQALNPDRIFDTLYVKTLVDLVTLQNPKSPFTVNTTTINGVFDTSGGTSLQLLVDIKTDGVEALPYILKALQPLRELGYLTTYANGTLTPSAITVIGTGNSPLEQVKALSPRDYFFDAPLTELTNTTLNAKWDATLSPIASTDYEVAVCWNGIDSISEAQLANITRFVSDAHERGIKARFWDTPGWPIFARNAVWQVLLDNGADWLNADDLEAAAAF